MLCLRDFESGFYGLVRCGRATHPLQVPVVVVAWEPTGKREPSLNAPQLQQFVFGPGRSVAGWFAENSQGRVLLVPHPAVPVVGPIQSIHDWTLYWRVQSFDPKNLDKNDPHRWVDSHGRWEPKGTVLYRDDQGFVGGHIHAYAEMVRAAAEEPLVDLAAFDINGNHRLEPSECLFLLVKAQADPDGFEREVWASQVPEVELEVDGVIVKPIAELYGAPPHEDDELAIASEELLHLLADLSDQYPDRQDGFPQGKNRREDDPGRPGQLSLTDAVRRPVHVDPYHKLKWGWLNPQLAHTSGRYTLRAAATTGEALILYSPDVGTDEFFIVENRWRGTSYDQSRDGLWGEGLAIWHCIQDPDLAADWGRRAVHLRRADPRLDAQGNLQNGLALFDGASPGRDYDLDDDSAPNDLRFRNGVRSGLKIRNISAAGPEMSFDLVVPKQPDLFRFEKVGSNPAAHVYASAGQLCATNPDTGKVYLWTGPPPGSWVHAGGPGSAFVFAGSKPRLYGRSPDGSGVWRRTWVQGEEEFDGSFEWQKIKGPTGLLLTDGESVYATEPHHPGSSGYPSLSKFHDDASGTWSTISGPGLTFAAGDHIYRLVEEGDVERWNGGIWEPLGSPAGVTLDTLYAGGTQVFGTYQAAPGVTGPIFRYTSTGWVRIGGPGEAFVTDDSGGLYGLSPVDGSIWLWEGVPGAWTNLNFKAREIAATGTRQLFAISRVDDTLWQFMPDIDLSIVDWSYAKTPDVIRFYGVLVNRGRYPSHRGKTAKAQLVFATSNGTVRETRREFVVDSDDLGGCETTLVGPVEFPFDKDAKYYVGSLTVSHPDDANPANNSYEPSHEERIEGMKGSRFSGGGDLTHKYM